MTDKKKESDWESFKSLAIAIFVALLFRSFFFEPFHIPSGSMLSTLYTGDYIFVSKFSYGYSRYSFPFNIPPFNGRIMRHAPQRGDVVVFRVPSNTHVDFIKRIIGLPGDTIQMRHGRLYINNVMVEQTRNGEVSIPDQFDIPRQIPRYTEKLPNGKEHIVLDAISEGPVDNTEVFTVPAGDYFMMGDNRDNSEDSRYQNVVGYVPEQNLVGRAVIVLGSFQGHVPFWQVWNWPHAFRNDRWFMSIH